MNPARRLLRHAPAPSTGPPTATSNQIRRYCTHARADTRPPCPFVSFVVHLPPPRATRRNTAPQKTTFSLPAQNEPKTCNPLQPSATPCNRSRRRKTNPPRVPLQHSSFIIQHSLLLPLPS